MEGLLILSTKHDPRRPAHTGEFLSKILKRKQAKQVLDTEHYRQRKKGTSKSLSIRECLEFSKDVMESRGLSRAECAAGEEVTMSLLKQCCVRQNRHV